MRRKRHDSATTVPAELRRFEPTASLREWLDARKGWWEKHPDAWPDIIAVLGPGANIRARRAGRRVPYPELDEGSDR